MEVQEMASKDESGLEGHDSGGVKIAARTEGVFGLAGAMKDEQSRAGYER
jgi:hypothetical protein